MVIYTRGIKNIIIIKDTENSLAIVGFIVILFTDKV